MTFFPRIYSQNVFGLVSETGHFNGQVLLKLYRCFCSFTFLQWVKGFSTEQYEYQFEALFFYPPISYTPCMANKLLKVWAGATVNKIYLLWDKWPFRALLAVPARPYHQTKNHNTLVFKYTQICSSTTI